MKINKEKILKIGLPILAIGLVGFYFWNKKRKSALAEPIAETKLPETKTEPVKSAPIITPVKNSGVALPGQASNKIVPLQPPGNTGIIAPKITNPTTGVAFGSVQEYLNATLPATDKRVHGAKFILTAPNTSFKVGQTITIDSPLYKGTAQIWSVWNNQHLFTTMPFKGTSSGTLK
jgi:hypothetical protein